jgi:predicted RND superfamily exporter protein
MRINRLHTWLEHLLSASQRRSTVVFTAAGAAALVGVLLISRLSFDADVLRLLPRDAPTVQAFERFLRDFGSLDHLYVVFESSDAIGGHGDVVDAFVEALRKAPEIESVDAALFEEGKDWTYLYDRELFLLGPTDAAEALSRLRPPALDRELAHARDLLQTPSSEIKTMVQQDPLGLLTLLRNRFARQKGFVTFDPTQEGYVSADGRSRLVIVKPKGAPFDTDFCKMLFRRLDEVEKTARASVDDGAGATPVKIFSAGAYRVSLEAESLIRRETIVNSLGSLVLLVAIVIALFRTPWMIVYGTVPLALAAVLALGLAGLTVGRLSPATSGSAAMLFGLGIDGIALLYMRYLEEREAGALPADACKGMSGTALGVLLAQLTTAATFFALLFIDFPTLRDLGGLVGTGILLSCAFTLVLLPALLARDSTTRGRVLTATWLGNFVMRHSRAIVVAGALATVILGAAATRIRVDMSLERLQARTSDVDLERDVAARFSLPTDVLLVVNESPTLDPLLDTDARLAETFASRLPTVAVSGISLVLPPSATQQMVADEIRRVAPSAEGVVPDIRAGALRAGFRPEAVEPFIERLPRLLDADVRITYDGLLEHGLDPIISRFVSHRDGRYSAVAYLYPQQAIDLAAIEATIHAVDPRLQLSGLPAINRELGRLFPREFVKGLLLGTAAVALLIYAVFRTVRLTLLTLLPTAAGFVWSAGWLALARVELDLFSMFAAVTCVGIAVNYGIYVLHRYAIEGSEDVREVLSRTGAAILIACTTALVGFGTLVISSYRPLRVFGIVSVVTLSCCVTASLLLLPAILIQSKR